MYAIALFAHAWIRWLVVIVGLIVLVRGIVGWSGGRAWGAADARAPRLFTIALDVQTLIGLALYVALSPVTQVAFTDMGTAMRNAGLRFYAVEHLVGMVVALALAHIGGARIKRSRSDAGRHRLAVVFIGLALLVILLSIPWPGSPSARPLFRY